MSPLRRRLRKYWDDDLCRIAEEAVAAVGFGFVTIRGKTGPNSAFRNIYGISSIKLQWLIAQLEANPTVRILACEPGTNTRRCRLRASGCLPGLEAMACGIPTVLPAEGGLTEYAAHEHNTLLAAETGERVKAI